MCNFGDLASPYKAYTSCELNARALRGFTKKDRYCEGKKEPRSSGTPPPSLAVLDAEVANPGVEDDAKNCLISEARLKT